MYQLVADTGEFLVVDKAAGVPVHGPSPLPTLIEQLRKDFDNPALNLVHRLDTGTSGLVLIAKNASANRQLAQLFAEEAVCKRYLGHRRAEDRSLRNICRPADGMCANGRGVG